MNKLEKKLEKRRDVLDQLEAQWAYLENNSWFPIIRLQLSGKVFKKGRFKQFFLQTET